MNDLFVPIPHDGDETPEVFEIRRLCMKLNYYQGTEFEYRGKYEGRLQEAIVELRKLAGE